MKKSELATHHHSESRYYRIVLRPKSDFVLFRTQDVGRPGGLLRVSGQRRNGSWATQAWLVDKHMAHPEGNILIPDSAAAAKLLAGFGTTPMRRTGNVFTAKVRRIVREKVKPTPAS